MVLLWAIYFINGLFKTTLRAKNGLFNYEHIQFITQMKTHKGLYNKYGLIMGYLITINRTINATQWAIY